MKDLKNGQTIKQTTSLKSPFGIDFNEKTSLLYICSYDLIHILNLGLENVVIFTLPVWTIPKESYSRAIKSDDSRYYLTISKIHRVFSCNIENGRIHKQWGVEAATSNRGEFNEPRGVTVDNKYLYVCDSNNHRVQIISKNEGNIITQWGSIGQYPWSIHYSPKEELFFIGNMTCVQVVERNGQIIQTIGSTQSGGDQMNQFNAVFGLSVMGERLYVSDSRNERIQMFNRDTR